MSRPARILAWLDERTGAAGVLRMGLRKVFPDHWSFLLGEIAAFCFVILVATGTFLTLFYVPSAGQTIYSGPYDPLNGVPVSEAFSSVLGLSFQVQAGLLMRQIHHWSALVFVGAIIVHLCRIFFTGAFRRPRELNWLIGIVLLLLALAEGFTGYSLPDDLLSGTGARIGYSAVLALPFVGPWIASLIFGGEFPTAEMIPRFFVIHVLLLPVLFGALIATHIGLVVLQKHTQFPGGRAREDNVVGRFLWPGQAFLSVGLFFITGAVLAALGGLVQVNPIWAYGPFDASLVSAPAQPDWYVGWLDGALRIFPPFEPTIFGVTLPSTLIPGLVVPGLLFGVITLWPFIEQWRTRDRAAHHILQWPWERPGRTAIGVAVLLIFVTLTAAGGNDLLAFAFSTDLEALTRIFRILVLVVPVVGGLVTWRICIAVRDRRQRGDSDGDTRSGHALRRTSSGGFEEIHE